MEQYLKEMQFWDVFVTVIFVLGTLFSYYVYRQNKAVLTGNFLAIPLWLIVLFALLLRLPMLFHAPWYDETFSHAITLPSWEDFPSVLLSDVHPPLHYIIVRLFSFFGRDMLIMRLPSLITGLALIVAIHCLSFHLTKSRQIAQQTAIFAAMLPSLIYYSTEARYPIFLSLAVVLGFYAMLTERRFVFVLCCALAVGFHATGLFYAYALVAAGIVYHGKKWIGVSIGAALVSLWWLPFMLSQTGDVKNGFWLPLQSPAMHMIEMTFLRSGSSLIILILGSFAGVFLISIATIHAIKRRDYALMLLVWGVPLGVWLLSALWIPVYLPRALLSSTVLALPYSFWEIYSLKQRNSVLLSLLLITAMSVFSLWQSDRGKREAEVFQLCENADYVFVPETFLAIMARYYFEDNVIAWTESDNRHQTFETSSFEAIGIERLDGIESLNGSICIPYRLDYFTEEEEIRFIESIEGETIAISEQHHLLRYFALLVDR